MMSSMPGCTINSLCQTKKYSSPYCQPFSIYKDICTQMPRMSNCSIYRSMCVAGSVVKECNTTVLPLPSSSSLLEYITQICSDMNMAPCAQCDSSTCDYLTVYSELCLSMPSMENCSFWHSMF